jgi:hypothetical protein
MLATKPNKISAAEKIKAKETGFSLHKCLSYSEAFQRTINHHKGTLNLSPANYYSVGKTNWTSSIHFKIRPRNAKEIADQLYQVAFADEAHGSLIYMPSFSVLTDACLDGIGD